MANRACSCRRSNADQAGFLESDALGCPVRLLPPIAVVQDFMCSPAAEFRAGDHRRLAAIRTIHDTVDHPILIRLFGR